MSGSSAELSETDTSEEAEVEAFEPKDIDDYSYEQLEELSNDPDAMNVLNSLELGEDPFPTAEEDGEPEAPSDPEPAETPEPEPEEAPAPEPEPEPEPATEQDRVNRVSLRNVSDEQSIEIARLTREYQDSGTELEFAEWVASQQAPPSTPTASDGDDESEAPDAPQAEQQESEAVTAQKAKIAEIEAEIDKLNAEYQTAEADKAVSDLTLAKMELNQIKANEVEAAKQQEIYAAAEADSLERVHESYPDLRDESSQLRTRFEERAAYLEKTNPAFFNDPNWAETLANEVAPQVGVESATPAAPDENASAPGSQQKTPAPAVKTRPVVGSVAGASEGGDPPLVINPKDAEKIVKNLSDEEIDKVAQFL